MVIDARQPRRFPRPSHCLLCSRPVREIGAQHIKFLRYTWVIGNANANRDRALERKCRTVRNLWARTVKKLDIPLDRRRSNVTSPSPQRKRNTTGNGEARNVWPPLHETGVHHHSDPTSTFRPVAWIGHAPVKPPLNGDGVYRWRRSGGHAQQVV